jgi:hypothetical protein
MTVYLSTQSYLNVREAFDQGVFKEGALFARLILRRTTNVCMGLAVCSVQGLCRGHDTRPSNTVRSLQSESLLISMVYANRANSVQITTNRVCRIRNDGAAPSIPSFTAPFLIEAFPVLAHCICSIDPTKASDYLSDGVVSSSGFHEWTSERQKLVPRYRRLVAFSRLR